MAALSPEFSEAFASSPPDHDPQPAIFARSRAALSDSDGMTSAPARASFETIYSENIDLVWRSLRGLGVADASIEDAAQDVFLVVHRRLEGFEARSAFRTWLYGIVLHTARNYRRTMRRKGGLAPLESAPEMVDAAPGPDEDAAAAEALRTLASLLESLDEQKREVFVLAELEQMSAPEIAAALGVNTNTVYSRLRAARQMFEVAVRRSQRGER